MSKKARQGRIGVTVLALLVGLLAGVPLGAEVSRHKFRQRARGAGVDEAVVESLTGDVKTVKVPAKCPCTNQ